MVPYIRIGSGLTRNGQGRHLTITGPEVSGFQTSTVHLKNIGINGISNIVCEKIIINDILCHTKEMIKFLRSIKTGKYNAYQNKGYNDTDNQCGGYSDFCEKPFKVLRHKLLFLQNVICIRYYI